MTSNNTGRWAAFRPQVQAGGRFLVYRFLPLVILGFITAFAFYQGISVFQYDDYYSWMILFLWAAVIGAVIISPGFRRLLGRADVRWMLPLIIVAGAALRVYFINTVPTCPIFDFATYHNTASAISQGNWEALKALEGRPWGYVLVLGLTYRIFGTGFVAAQYLNVILGALVVWLVYIIVKLLTGKPYALLAALFLSFFPSQVFMANVINSEILFMVLALGGLYWSLRFMQDYNLRDLAFCAIFFGLAHIVRPVGMIYLLAFLGFLFTQLVPRYMRGFLKYLAVAAVCFYLVLVPFLAFKSVLYRQPVFWEKGTFGIVFLMGTNIEHRGFWNQADYDYIRQLEVKYANNAEKVNSEAFRTALWRLRSSDEFKLILPAKVFNMWSIDTYGFDWANVGPEGSKIITGEKTLKNYYGISQLFYCFILFFTLVLLAGSRLEQEASFRYLFAVFLCFFFLHLFIEVQGRYHMHLVPVLLTVLACGLAARDRKEIIT